MTRRLMRPYTLQRGIRRAALGLGAAIVLAATWTVLLPGDYVGSDECVVCHDVVVNVPFEATAHGRADIKGWDGGAGCEACHGPGQEHVDSGGEVGNIINPAKLDAAEASGACLECHEGGAAAHWRGSAHEAYDVSCNDCHRVHAPWTAEQALVNRDVNETCLDCHKNMRKHLYQRSSHPLRDGLMSCVSCHDPHGSMAESAMAALTPNDKCYECHADKRGPYLFEHAPVREDCGNCHNPHGSNQTMLLTASAPRMCQSCHLFGHHQTVPGTPGQVWNRNRSCLNCHPRIHGSNHPSGVIFMR